MPNRIKDLTGKRFGLLTVIERASEKGKPLKWKCRCDCGNIYYIGSSELQRDKMPSCGCYYVAPHKKVIAGQRFGKLVTIKEIGTNKDHAPLWLCKCDCGNDYVTSAKNLISGSAKSCRKHPQTDLTGMRFGRLTVKSYSRYDKDHIWECECDCGTICEKSGGLLRSGHALSCGCLVKEIITKHGKTDSRLHHIWTSMKQRCLNEKTVGYHRYGGRGITVCEEWKNDFRTFYDWAVKNGYSDELQLDRRDNNGNYEPSNCRWVTPKENMLNRNNNIKVTYNGKTQTISEWSEETGIRPNILRQRHKRGWTAERMLTTPVIHKKKGANSA